MPNPHQEIVDYFTDLLVLCGLCLSLFFHLTLLLSIITPFALGFLEDEPAAASQSLVIWTAPEEPAESYSDEDCKIHHYIDYLQTPHQPRQPLAIDNGSVSPALKRTLDTDTIRAAALLVTRDVRNTHGLHHKASLLLDSIINKRSRTSYLVAARKRTITASTLAEAARVVSRF